MTDKEMLNWIAANLTALRGLPNETVEIDWLDDKGYSRRTTGDSLSHAVNKAVSDDGEYLGEW